MITIKRWSGRNGNNIIQILNSIHYAKIKKHRYIKFPKHDLINGNIIELDDIAKTSETVSGYFYIIKNEFKIDPPEPYLMKEYFQKYVSNIFRIKPKQQNNIDLDELYIHIRSGDVFSNNPHKGYVQPPLSYYKNIMKDYTKVKIVYEDNKNPCVNELLKYDNVESVRGKSLVDDLNTLINATNLVIGYGTFGYMLYLINNNLKNLYVPEYFINIFNGDCGDDINIHSIELKDYIKVGDWKNTSKQREIMLNYK